MRNEVVSHPSVVCEILLANGVLVAIFYVGAQAAPLMTN